MSAELLLDMSIDHRRSQDNGISDFLTILPQSAIVKADEDNQIKVWRYNQDSNRVESVIVTLGQVRTNGIEVLSGLNKGDKIVSVGANAIKSGMEVKPLRWERGV